MARPIATVGTALEQLSTNQIFRMDPKEVRETFSQPERELFNKIKKQYIDRVTDDLLWCHSVGKELADGLESAAKPSANSNGDRTTTWGAHVVERMARGMGLRSADQLYQALEIFNAWPSREDFRREIVNRVGPSNNHLTFNHAAALARIESRGQREKAVEQVLDKNMTVRETNRLVSGKQPAKQLNNPRKLFKRPESFAQAIVDVSKTLKSLSRKCSDAWLKDPSIVEMAGKLQPYQVTPDLLRVVDEAVEELKAAKTSLDLLEKAVDLSVSSLKERAAGEKATPAKSLNVPEECPRGGQHEYKTEDGDTFCVKCCDNPNAKVEKARRTKPPSSKNRSRRKLRTNDSPK